VADSRYCRNSDVFTYRADILDALLNHGVRPASHTRPELVREFVGDLYRYEIRRLRARFLRKEFPKAEYYGRVVDLRNKYKVLSMRAHEWIVEPDRPSGGFGR
jgi:hypothetical protein